MTCQTLLFNACLFAACNTCAAHTQRRTTFQFGTQSVAVFAILSQVAENRCHRNVGHSKSKAIVHLRIIYFKLTYNKSYIQIIEPTLAKVSTGMLALTPLDLSDTQSSASAATDWHFAFSRGLQLSSFFLFEVLYHNSVLFSEKRLISQDQLAFW